MRRLLVTPALLAVIASCGGASSEATAPKRQSVLASIASTTPASGAGLPKKEPRVDTTLPPRAVFFSNPDRARPMISPDGKRLAWLAADGGVMNVWVAPTGDLTKAKVVTHETKRGVRTYRWAFTNDHILYPQDQGGDENWHVHAVDVKTGTEKDLTPIEGVAARIEALSERAPREVLVGINDRDKKWHDVYRVDVVTGAKKLVQKNEGFAAFVADHDLKIRLGMKPTGDGGIAMTEPDGKGGFREFAKIPMEDAITTQVVGFDKAGQKAFLVDSRERDTAALVELDLATKKTKVILDDGQADIVDIEQHPTDKRVQAALAEYDRLRWHAVDAALRTDLDVIQAAAPGDMHVLSRTNDDTRWVISTVVSDGPRKFWLYDRPKKKVEFLFSNIKALEDVKLSAMRPVHIRSRDGLDLVSYLTLPRELDADNDGVPDAGKGPAPMVLLVHGGPWGRDVWGLSGYHQWLASRGYAVLSVNYRGSTGFGKKFVNAADKQWAAKMHDDLLDATAWATGEHIADPQRVAIMGGSYGGYATLVGLTFTPETFACGVDIVGPSNLVTLLQSVPPYWEAEVEQFARRIGDHRTDEGKKLLLERSPLTHVDRIKRPLLIGQGANDPRVKQAESDQIVKAMQAKNIPVTYVLYPDEGHGFARPENNKSFTAVAEVFLAQCLGGPYQPIGRDFEGSSIKVPAGKENIATLPSALP